MLLIRKNNLMTQDITYRLAENGDLEKIKGLLTRAELPVDDINASKIDFVVATNGSSDLIGCIGLERYGADGLLRSFAVDPAYRGTGIGHELLHRLLSRDGKSELHNVHLLTTTAERFFDRYGFRVVSREEAPASIKDTVEFTSLCPSSSTYMVLKRPIKEETIAP